MCIARTHASRPSAERALTCRLRAAVVPIAQRPVSGLRIRRSVDRDDAQPAKYSIECQRPAPFTVLRLMNHTLCRMTQCTLALALARRTAAKNNASAAGCALFPSLKFLPDCNCIQLPEREARESLHNVDDNKDELDKQQEKSSAQHYAALTSSMNSTTAISAVVIAILTHGINAVALTSPLIWTAENGKILLNGKHDSTSAQC